MARKVARKSLVHPLDLAHYKREAEKEFPMDKPDIALNKYVRLHKKEGVFFWDDDGNSTHRDYLLWGPGQYNPILFDPYASPLFRIQER